MFLDSRRASTGAGTVAALERLHVAALDPGIITFIPRTLRVLVVSGVALTDQLVALIARRCRSLEQLRVGDDSAVAKVSEAGWKHVLGLPAMKRLWLRTDRQVPVSVLKRVAELQIQFDLVFSVSLDVLQAVARLADEAAGPLVVRVDVTVARLT
jgi:hypothetical protein